MLESIQHSLEEDLLINHHGFIQWGDPHPQKSFARSNDLEIEFLDEYLKHFILKFGVSGV